VTWAFRRLLAHRIFPCNAHSTFCSHHRSQHQPSPLVGNDTQAMLPCVDNSRDFDAFQYNTALTSKIGSAAIAHMTAIVVVGFSGIRENNQVCDRSARSRYSVQCSHIVVSLSQEVRHLE
jgi:hypothetical protein